MLVRIYLVEENLIETDLHPQSVWLGALHNYPHHPSPSPTQQVWKKELLIYIPLIDCLRTVLWLPDCPTLMLIFPFHCPSSPTTGSITLSLLVCSVVAGLKQTSARQVGVLKTLTLITNPLVSALSYCMTKHSNILPSVGLLTRKGKSSEVQMKAAPG